MINKFSKIIHSKNLKIFQFFFYLRYLFAVFLISILLFLLIPKFLNFDEKQEIINKNLDNHYNLQINNFSSINFKIFPLPNLYISNADLKVSNKPINFRVKDFRIYLKLKNIYNQKNLIPKKILINSSEVDLEIKDSKELFNFLASFKSKLEISNLNISLNKEKERIIKIKNIDYSNYGHKKNKIEGVLFNKKFEAILKNNELKFNILKTGIKIKLNFDKINNLKLISGSSKINILDYYLKSNFLFKTNKLEVTNSNLRNKNLSILFNSTIDFDPFFKINSSIKVNKIDKNPFRNLNIEKLLQNPEIIKKLNSINKITYKKKGWNNLIKENLFEFSLSHGRLLFLSKTIVSSGEMKCKGDSLLVDDYPRLNFNCELSLKDKNEFLSEMSIKKRFDGKKLNLNVVGSLNLLNKKINFQEIKYNSEYAKKEEMSYYKEKFESVIFKENFFNIFKKYKIKEFIIEII